MSPSPATLSRTPPPEIPAVNGSPLATRALGGEHCAEALAFLAARPLHTFVMSGLLRDNGPVSPLNRGSFYACRNSDGELEGVALIGHATLFEARTDRALEAFARLAQSYTRAHLLSGERESVAKFWGYYRESGQKMRLSCREMLFDLRWPVMTREPVPALRRATPDDLALVMPVQAEMAESESGVNPLEVDPEGFRGRCARRIAKGRSWVLTEGGRPIFKAEVLSETPEVTYLEGVHVHPAERGRGVGLRCLSQLGRTLLRQSESVCLLVNEQNLAAQAFYRKAGYGPRGSYDMLFLSSRGDR